jgi:hypothetical protein
VGTKATPEVIQSWVEVYQLYRELRGERRERLQQVADRLGITFKVARRRLRNYEAMNGQRAPADRPASPREPPRRAKDAPAAEFRDRQLTCADCGGQFTWTASEQAFFREKGFTNEPKRCKACRQDRKERSAKRTGEKKGGK